MPTLSQAVVDKRLSNGTIRMYCYLRQWQRAETVPQMGEAIGMGGRHAYRCITQLWEAGYIRIEYDPDDRRKRRYVVL